MASTYLEKVNHWIKEFVGKLAIHFVKKILHRIFFEI